MTKILSALERNIRFEFCKKYCYFTVPVFCNHEQVNILNFQILNSEMHEFRNTADLIKVFPYGDGSCYKMGIEHAKPNRLYEVLK